MRDLVQRLLQMNQFDLLLDDRVKAVLEPVRENFAQVYGETLPAEAAEALGALDRAFRARRDDLEQALASVYERFLTEADLRALLAWIESPAGVRTQGVAAEVQRGLAEATDAWIHETLRAAEPDLLRILGHPTDAPGDLPGPLPPAPGATAA